MKNEMWFVDKDIAKILEYQNTRQAILTNVDVEDKMKVQDLRSQLNGPLNKQTAEFLARNK